MQNSNSTENNENYYPIVKATVVDVSCPSFLIEDKNNTKKSYNNTVRETLKSQGYTDGLIQSIARSNEAFPVRIWVVDNSGSMYTADGHRLHQSSGNDTTNCVRLLDCSRWAEIQDTVTYHAQMAALLQAPTSFRLPNPARGIEQFGVAERGPEYSSEDLRFATNTIRELLPSGATPLSKRVREISMYIESIQDQRTARGQKAVVVLATDGLPSDNYGDSSKSYRYEFLRALRTLEGLPVWVVIRLCTDDDTIVDFYNTIDNELELNLDVLDDFLAEAKEVYEHNTWLNYALPLHRMREMGFYHKLFDLIDEGSLTRDELRDFFLLLYGPDAVDGLPDPQIDWPRFLDRVAEANDRETLQ